MARKAVEATGNLTLTIDSRKLQATATFIKGAGKTWALADLFALMVERGVTEGFKRDEVARLFNLIPGKPSPYTFTVATGTPPRDSKPETVEWLLGKISEELAAQAESVLTDAKPPEIYVQRRGKVTHTKTVEVKPKLPFIKSKTREESVTEETVTSERIYVDPTVERIGHIREGEKIGTVFGSEEGEAGRSVDGQPVPAKAVADPNFYAGPGVVRRSHELFAENEGFVRIGANWVDVVPFETHGWEVSLSEDKVTCFLSFDPGDPHAAPPTAEEIRAAAVKEGFDEERLISRDEITGIVAKAIAARKKIEMVPLTASRDAGFDIVISEDKLQAILSIHKGTGKGTPLDTKALGRAIKQSGLVGLNFQRIQTDVSAFIRSASTELTGYVLAEGVAPESGLERTVECSVRFLPADETAELKHHLAAALPRSVSEKSLAAFPAEMIEDLGYVESEQRLATMSPPAPGKPGTDVFGQVVQVTPAAEPQIVAHENVERKGNVFISTTAGLFQRGWKEGVTHFRVVEHRDAQVIVNLSPARMAAMISLVPHAGSGQRIEWEAIEAAVANAGIAKGVNEELLHRAHERLTMGTEIRDLIFARGSHPVGADHGDVELLVQLASGKDVTIRTNGTADFRNQDRITTVKAGTKLARLHRTTADSDDGWTVLGETLKADLSNSVELDAGTNVSVREEAAGTRVFVADIDGELILENNRFEIRVGHTVVGDVDLSTGNVKFPGTVTIKGSVRSGFVVMAAGNIQVGEMVEAALLSADGGIEVSQGVKGAGKAVLRAKNSIGLVFAEQATLLAVGNVQVKNSLVHCTVKTNGKVVMVGERGTILGGSLRCREGIETDNLGSESGVKTSVAFGQNYLIADRIENEEKEMAKIKKQVSEIDSAIREKQRERVKSELESLHARKLLLLKTLEKRGLRVFTLRERFEEHQESSVVVRGKMYPGVVFESHGRTLKIEAERENSRVTFNLESGRIEIADAGSKSAQTE